MGHTCLELQSLSFMDDSSQYILTLLIYLPHPLSLSCDVMQVQEVALVMDRATQTRRNFVFVTFKEPESAKKCIATTFHEVDGFKVSFLSENNLQLGLESPVRIGLQ